MAVCHWCRREMSSGMSCTESALHRGSAVWPLARTRRRCGDCGVAPGGLHHRGCDLQRCPRCKRQLITCGCPFDEHRDEDDEVVDDAFWEIVDRNRR
jgi:hypothetical protein